jgi:hypothetical protein
MDTGARLYKKYWKLQGYSVVLELPWRLDVFSLVVFFCRGHPLLL